MKKLAIVIALILITSAAFAQQWHTANQTTVAWDSAGDGIVYDIWLSNATTDPGKTNPVKIGEDIAELRYTITLNVEGRYFAGAQSKRYVDGELVGASDIAWSDDPEVCFEGKTFGLRYFVPPGQAKKLRIE